MDPKRLQPEEIGALYGQGRISADTASRMLGLDFDPSFVNAIAQVESGGRPEVVSPKGATGLMQIMPETAAEVARGIGLENYDLKNPEHSRLLGSVYLKQQLDKYGDKELAAAAYNAGPGRVDQALAQTGGKSFSDIVSILPSETRNYVPKVLQLYGKNPTRALREIQLLRSQEDAILRDSSSDVVRQELTQELEQGLLDEPIEQPLEQGGESVLPPLTRDSSSESDISKAFEQQQDALKSMQQQEMLAMQERSLILEDNKKKAENLQQQRLALQQERQRALDEARRNMEVARQEAFGASVDPSRFWLNKSTGEKILAGVSIFLGGFGAGLTGGPNQALGIINQAIVNDIEAQKAELEKKQRGFDNASNTYARVRELFNNEERTQLAMEALAKEKVQMQLKSLASGLKSSQQLAQWKKLDGQLEVEKQQALRKLEDSTQIVDTEVTSLMADIVSGKTDHSAVFRLPKEQRELWVKGLGFTTSKDAQKDLASYMKNSDSFLKTLDDIIALRKKHGPQFIGEIKSIQEAKAAELRGAWKNIQELGALDKGVFTIVDPMIPENPSQFWWTLGALEDTRKRVARDYRANLESAIQLGTPEYYEKILDVSKIEQMPTTEAKGVSLEDLIDMGLITNPGQTVGKALGKAVFE